MGNANTTSIREIIPFPFSKEEVKLKVRFFNPRLELHYHLWFADLEIEKVEIAEKVKLASTPSPVMLKKEPFCVDAYGLRVAN